MASATSPKHFFEIQLPANKSKTATPCVKIRVQLNEGKTNLLLYPNFDTRVTLAGVSDITNETLVSGNKFPKYIHKETEKKKRNTCVKNRVQQKEAKATVCCTRILTHVLRLLSFRIQTKKEKQAQA